MSAVYYLVGRIRRAHGLRGELVIEALTDAPDAIFAPGRRVLAGTREGDLSPDRQELRVLRSSPFKGGLIVAFEGIDDRTTADQWRDRHLLVPEEEIAAPNEDELFIHDLVGMRVLHVSGEEIGEVIEVFEVPQGLLIEVARAVDKTILLPFDDQTVSAVDAEQRVIRVDPLEGMID